MSGVLIVGELLRADAELVAVVPVDRIKAGRLPDGVPLPAIVARMVSLVERQKLIRKGWVRMTERVSVTVRAGNYRQQGAVIRLIRDGCAGRTGTIGGFANVVILAAGTGPDVAGPADSFEQTQDFRVSFDAPVK